MCNKHNITIQINFAILHMNNGIIFPLLLVSILCGFTMELPPDCISSLAINNDQFLFKCTELILTVSILSSLHSCDSSIASPFTALSLLLQHTFLKCPVLPQPMHVLLYARHCLSMCILPQYLHGHCCAVDLVDIFAVFLCPFYHLHLVKLP